MVSDGLTWSQVVLLVPDSLRWFWLLKIVHDGPWWITVGSSNGTSQPIYCNLFWDLRQPQVLVKWGLKKGQSFTKNGPRTGLLTIFFAIFRSLLAKFVGALNPKIGFDRLDGWDVLWLGPTPIYSELTVWTLRSGNPSISQFGPNFGHFRPPLAKANLGCP